MGVNSAFPFTLEGISVGIFNNKNVGIVCFFRGGVERSKIFLSGNYFSGLLQGISLLILAPFGMTFFSDSEGGGVNYFSCLTGKDF